MNEKIAAVRWMFGFTNAEAKKYISLAPAGLIEEIVNVWKKQAKLNFEED